MTEKKIVLNDGIKNYMKSKDIKDVNELVFKLHNLLDESMKLNDELKKDNNEWADFNKRCVKSVHRLTKSALRYLDVIFILEVFLLSVGVLAYVYILFLI